MFFQLFFFVFFNMSYFVFLKSVSIVALHWAYIDTNNSGRQCLVFMHTKQIKVQLLRGRRSASTLHSNNWTKCPLQLNNQMVAETRIVCICMTTAHIMEYGGMYLALIKLPISVASNPLVRIYIFMCFVLILTPILCIVIVFVERLHETKI